MEIRFNGITPQEKIYRVGVMGNNNVDNLIFILDNEQEGIFLNQCKPYLKISETVRKHGTYIDKDPELEILPAEDEGKLCLKYSVPKKAVGYKLLNMQLQFEYDDSLEAEGAESGNQSNRENAPIWQSEIFTVVFADTIEADKYIEKTEVAILRDYERRLTALEKGDYEAPVGNQAVKSNYTEEHIETEMDGNPMNILFKTCYQYFGENDPAEILVHGISRELPGIPEFLPLPLAITLLGAGLFEFSENSQETFLDIAHSRLLSSTVAATLSMGDMELEPLCITCDGITSMTNMDGGNMMPLVTAHYKGTDLSGVYLMWSDENNDITLNAANGSSGFGGGSASSDDWNDVNWDTDAEFWALCSSRGNYGRNVMLEFKSYYGASYVRLMVNLPNSGQSNWDVTVLESKNSQGLGGGNGLTLSCKWDRSDQTGNYDVPGLLLYKADGLRNTGIAWRVSTPQQLKIINGGCGGKAGDIINLSAIPDRFIPEN